MTIFSRPTLPARDQSSDGSGAGGGQIARPLLRTRFAARGRGRKPFAGTKKGVGPPYAATHWRSRATRKKKADGGSAASPVSGSGDGRLSSRAISGNAFTFLT